MGGGREGGHRKLYRQPVVHLYPDRILSPYYWARSERIGSKFSAVGSTE